MRPLCESDSETCDARAAATPDGRKRRRLAIGAHESVQADANGGLKLSEAANP